jgi:hypothetical protein
MHAGMDGWTDGWMDGWTDGWMGRWLDVDSADLSSLGHPDIFGVTRDVSRHACSLAWWPFAGTKQPCSIKSFRRRDSDFMFQIQKHISQQVKDTKTSFRKVVALVNSCNEFKDRNYDQQDQNIPNNTRQNRL